MNNSISNKRFFLPLLFVFLFGMHLAHTQTITEFPIAVGDDTTYAFSAAFDGINYCIPIVGDNGGQYNLTVQFVSKSGTLSGQRISLGRQAVPGALAAFDGANYLVCWNDFDTKLWGQFVSTAGTLTGAPFVIASWGWIGFGSLIYGDVSYFVIYEDTLTTPNHERLIYGKFISKIGVVGNAIQISDSEGYLDGDIAFDGTNYLAVWRGGGYNSPFVYGQFINKTGAVVGNNFIIDSSPDYSDNPVSAGFDGTRYLVCFEDEVDTTSDIWHLYGRFVTPAGIVEEKMTVSDIGNNHFCNLSFDGSHYLITYMNFVNILSNQVYCKGRYFNPSGIPLEDAFTIFSPVENKIPIGGVMLFDGNNFVIGANRVSMEISPEDDIIFTDGDVYGALVSPYPTSVNNNRLSETPGKFKIWQNYPNPFNPETLIQYALPKSSQVRIDVFNIKGERIITLVNEEKQAGYYTTIWNGRDKMGRQVAGGVYLCRIQTAKYSNTIRMILQK
ncbi:T9SS type A sorting domain-containing protein [bacterium]|nr:T9SS type A sorting domain-containing protein [bacterium]RQV96334.1 MAG: T9SS C-terminal target domain-containing protein [bacterium]